MLVRCILWIFIVFSLCLAAASAQAAAPAPVGTVVEVEGEATITRAGKTHKAEIDGEIYLDDLITTGPQSRVFVLLIDDTEWTLSEKTKFKVDDFVFDPDDNADNQARYSVLEGAFRYVSGLVAKKKNPDVEINTPVGSIGIRGTDFTGGPDDGGGYGVYVDEGSVNVANAGGATLLRQGEGASVRDRRTAPGRAQKWQRERVKRLQDRVRLKRQDIVRQRKAAMRERQQQMREKYRVTIRERLEKMKQERGGMQQRMEERQQQYREKMQDKIRQRREGRRGEFQQNAGEREGELREKMQDRTQQRRQQYMRRQRYNP